MFIEPIERRGGPLHHCLGKDVRGPKGAALGTHSVEHPMAVMLDRLGNHLGHHVALFGYPRHVVMGHAIDDAIEAGRTRSP